MSMKSHKDCTTTARNLALLVLAAAAVVWSTTPATAALLPINSAQVAVGEPEPGAGALLVTTTGPVPFIAIGYTGTLISSVYNNDPTNPFGLNALTFTYEITNNPGSTHDLHRFTVSSFAGFLTDTSYSTLGPGLAPTFVDRNSGVGDVVGFTYPTPIPGVIVGPGPITPGTTTAVMIIQTDATLWSPTLAAVINGSVTPVASLAPRAIPEPSTLVLAGMGAVGAAIAWKRRRRG